MRYWGKLLGVILGLLSGTGLWGGLLGLLMGHMLDNARTLRNRGIFTEKQMRQSLFFNTTFQVMGHLTKAKGRVTEMDIELASQLMDKMQLQGSARFAAQQAFSEGKANAFPLRDKLRELRALCVDRLDIVRTFMEIQCQVAFADGVLHPNEWHVLNVIAQELGVSRLQFERYIRMMERQQSGGHAYSGTDSYSAFQQDLAHDSILVDAYRVLGIRPDDDSVTIKRAWRKLMNEYHPDKLMAKTNIPPEMMEKAKQKTQKIQAAYDLIKREKGFK